MRQIEIGTIYANKMEYMERLLEIKVDTKK